VVDPTFRDVVDGRRVEVVQLFSALSDRGHEIGRLQHRQMLADRLPGHVQSGTQLPKVLATSGFQTVQQLTAARICQRPKDLVHLLPSRKFSHMAA
jgi:hypothetical protein